MVPDWPPLRENTPMDPLLKKVLAHSTLPPSQPTTASPGVMIPMEPGPSRRVPLTLQ